MQEEKQPPSEKLAPFLLSLFSGPEILLKTSIRLELDLLSSVLILQSQRS